MSYQWDEIAALAFTAAAALYLIRRVIASRQSCGSCAAAADCKQKPDSLVQLTAPARRPDRGLPHEVFAGEQSPLRKSL